jgi:hypothetical protein
MMFTNPAYQRVKVLKAQASQYDEALSNSRKLQEQRDTLGVKYRGISPESLARLSKMLPDTADNIRLVIDIQQMAQSYGMQIASIKFDTTQGVSSVNAAAVSAGTPADVAQAAKDYGVFDFEFVTTATYPNFLSFIKDVESSLRLTDVQSIDFSAPDPVKGTTNYTVKLRTYWLKS